MMNDPIHDQKLAMIQQDYAQQALLQEQQHDLEMRRVTFQTAREILNHHRMYGDEALGQFAENYLARGGDPNYLREVVHSLARAGQMQTAIALHESIPD